MLVEEDYRVKGRPEPEVLERHRKVAPAKRMKIPGFVKGAKARQCKSKHRYRDIELAKLVLRRFPEQRIYACKFCGGYHLTKNPVFEPEPPEPPVLIQEGEPNAQEVQIEVEVQVH